MPLEKVDTNPEMGLVEFEAKLRLERDNPNALTLPQTRIFHILTITGVLGIVPQLVISAITGYCFRIHLTFSSCLKFGSGKRGEVEMEK